MITYFLVVLFLNYLSFPETESALKSHFTEFQDRSPKFFPFFLGPTYVRFPNEPCIGENGLMGTCYSRLECSKLGGFASGVCAKGLGSCCIVKRTCLQSTNINSTYFSNPEYPAPYLGNGVPCSLTVWKCNKEICQIKLDFIDFNLGEPDALGRCTNDFLLISGSGSNFRRICGLNSGQHIYVEFAAENPIELVIDTNNILSVDRRWNIKISQVECCKRAPVGCSMFYTATSGKVMSFNYSPLMSSAVPDPNFPGPGTRQLSNLNYGVCIQMVPGYCSIEWTQSVIDKYSFTVSGDTEALDDTLLGTPEASILGENCTSNFVIIPNPTIDGMPSKSDRFCGNGFPTVVSSSKPFVLTVVTNPTLSTAVPPPELPDVGNRGFSLNYRQLPCI